MEWFFHTRAWRGMHGHADGETGGWRARRVDRRRVATIRQYLQASVAGERAAHVLLRKRP